MSLLTATFGETELVVFVPLECASVVRLSLSAQNRPAFRAFDLSQAQDRTFMHPPHLQSGMSGCEEL
jgi:hypothetical protein